MIRARTILAATLVFLSTILIVDTADARPRHHHRHHISVQSERPAGCPRLWCGCFLARYLGIAGDNLNLAMNWLRVGSPASHGCTNCVAVMSRRGGGHVGLVQGYDGNGNPIILSGNHNRRVATAVYPARRIIAYRQI